MLRTTSPTANRHAQGIPQESPRKKRPSRPTETLFRWSFQAKKPLAHTQSKIPTADGITVSAPRPMASKPPGVINKFTTSPLMW